MRNSWISLVGVQQEAHFKTSNLGVTMGFLLLRTFANNQKQIDLLLGTAQKTDVVWITQSRP